MKKQLFLILICLVGVSFSSRAQTANEILGGSVISFNINGVQQAYITGVSLTTGDFNTLIGDGAGALLVNGSRNVMVGTLAGANSFDDSDNVFIGSEAGRFTTTFDNVFVGAEAGENNDTGTDNTFIGEESGTNNVAGSNNTFVGEDSGFTNTSGAANTFMGSGAGRFNTTASGNTFIGGDTGIQTTVDALFGNTNKYDLDTFTVRGSGYGNTTGQANSFLGGGSGHSNIEGTANTFLGYNAGARNQQGNLNTFVGYGSGWNNDTSSTGIVGGDRNTYLGAIAGSLNRSGNDNVGLGHDANFSLSSDASRNVFIGNNSRVRGTDNIVLGYNAQTRTSTDRHQQIVIGSNSQTLQDNAAVIGHSVTNNVENSLLLGGGTSGNKYSVGIGVSTVNSDASLTLGDTDKGVLINRLTTAQRIAMTTSPASGSPLNSADIGLMVYDTTELALYIWEGASWKSTDVNTDEQAINLSSNTLSITGNASTVDLSTYLDNTDAQDLSLTGSTLNISDGTGVDLSSLQDGIGTDEQAINLSSNTLSITGNASTVDLSTYLDNTDTQDLSLIGSTLIISNGTGVDLSSLQDGTGTDEQAINLSSNTLSISGNASTVDLSTYLDNTDVQDLSLTGSTLNISNGTGVDLSGLQDGTGTDEQALGLSSHTLSITGNASTVDLSSYLDNTDTQNLTSATLSGNTLTVAIENGSSVLVDLSPILLGLETDNDNQQILINDLMTRLTILEDCACQILDTEDVNMNRNMGPILYQNIPNPFNGTTSIKYFVPTNFKKAAIVFSNSVGQIIDNVSLKDLGENEMFFNSESLSAGTYYYTLFVEGRKIDSKKMIIE